MAVALAGLLGLLAARIATGDWPGGQDVTGLSNRLHFPGIRLAMATAVISVVNANLTRPLASTGRRVLALGAAGALMDGRTTVGGTAAAVLIGVTAGAAVRLRAGHLRGAPDDRTTWPRHWTIWASGRRISKRPSARRQVSSSSMGGSRAGQG